MNYDLKPLYYPINSNHNALNKVLIYMNILLKICQNLYRLVAVREVSKQRVSNRDEYSFTPSRAQFLLCIGLKLTQIAFTKVRFAEKGIYVNGFSGRLLPYQDLLITPEIKTKLRFKFIQYHFKAAGKVNVLLQNEKDAKRIIQVAISELEKYIRDLCQTNSSELKFIEELTARLKRPKRYPAACLLNPLAKRAEEALGLFPESSLFLYLNHPKAKALEEARSMLADIQLTKEMAEKYFISHELKRSKDFFESIASHPLTAEQRLAVITDEDATLVLAGAGSGKTVVIVAKAAYLIENQISAPEEILLMAFGRDAANEMAERIKDFAGVNVDAMTFHALGNKIIRQVEGKGAPLAAHASDDAAYYLLIREILLNDLIKRADLRPLLLSWFTSLLNPYKNNWDFGSQEEYQSWVDSNEYRTLNGDKVKSFEELEIANWLHLNGIDYQYEPEYPHEIKSTEKGAYHPDFLLTESGVYIEHFGVRKEKAENGEYRLTTAPYIDRDSYLAGMEWKRSIHKQFNTTLVETFSYENVDGVLIDNLKEKLKDYIEIKPVSAEAALATLKDSGYMDSFTEAAGTFLKHFKSMQMTISDCSKKDSSNRAQAFLKIFKPLLDAYEKRLGNYIDFEDMINKATHYVETGRYKSPYKHLLIDEFQDISYGRARLIKALKNQHSDARIFAVGDDWQSIFRFAGSDIHLMQGFGEEFGGTLGEESGIYAQVDLGRTFRSVEEISIPAREFVLKNPDQIRKSVKAHKSSGKSSIFVEYYYAGKEFNALLNALDRVSKGSGGEKKTVLLLGRYNHLKPNNMAYLKKRYSNLDISFLSIHKSKGLEADHVIILKMKSGEEGFPVEIVDDPLLSMVLPKPERYSHAEERRLFYVALTRAKETVTLLVDREKPSVFVEQLANIISTR